MIELLATLVLFAAPCPQGGYTTEDVPEHGVSLPRPRDFVPASLPRGDHWRVLYLVEKQSVGEREGRSMPAVCFLVRIDGDPEGARAPEEGGEPITDFDGYLAAFHARWGRSAPRAERERDGFLGREYELVKDGETSGASWCFVYERAEPTPRTYALVGYCGRTDLEALVPIWREMATKMRFSEPVAPDHSGIERLYAKKPFPSVEQRIELRRRLVRGWDAEDTEHYIALVHEPRKPFLKRVLADLEVLHASFEALFGLAAPDSALGVVRLCETRDEYLVYGGDPGYAALWNDSIGELVCFDPVKDGDRAGEDAALATLRGQALAQYLHPRLGGLAHPWFVWGHAEYFSGAKVSGKSLRVRPSSNLAFVQSRIEKGKLTPAAQLMGMDLKAFDAGREFASSGSLVYFLRESKEAASDARLSGLLERYLTTLVATRDARLAAGDDAPTARRAAREAALAAALEGVDLAELDRAWSTSTSRLKAD